MDTLEALSSRIETTEEIGSIVRTMKAVSAVSIRQYDQAVLALKDFHRTIELGLQVVLGDERTEIRPEREKEGRTAAIVFGSDRGLCGGFNRSVVDLAAGELGWTTKGAEVPLIVAVGARAAARLEVQLVQLQRADRVPQTLGNAINILVKGATRLLIVDQHLAVLALAQHGLGLAAILAISLPAGKNRMMLSRPIPTWTRASEVVTQAHRLTVG